jgi:hypothetical protein
MLASRFNNRVSTIGVKTMKTWTQALLMSVVALTIALPAQAQPGRGDFYHRLERQQAKVERGIDSGELTRREAGELRDEHREVRRLAERLRADGYSPRESDRILNRKLDRTERQLERYLHNDDYRRGRDDRPHGDGRPPREPHYGRD